jgi:hypothetical protein
MIPGILLHLADLDMWSPPKSSGTGMKSLQDTAQTPKLFLNPLIHNQRLVCVFGHKSGHGPPTTTTAATKEIMVSEDYACTTKSLLPPQFTPSRFQSLIPFSPTMASAIAGNATAPGSSNFDVGSLINGLFTDFAPLLGLFGNEITKQYLATSMGWGADILLALAPIRIMTVLVSAIHISGYPLMKSIIGDKNF